MSTLDFTGCLATPDRRPIWQWAEDHVELPPRLARPGKFSVTRERHFIGPLDALHDDHVREVNILAPTRGGKTLIADVWLPWLVVNDAGPFIHVFQKDPIAEGHAAERSNPTLRLCAPSSAKLPREHKDTNTSVKFSNGMQYEICGPALSNLQSRGFRYAVVDEPWMIDCEGSGAGYRKGAIGEIKARLGDFQKLATDKLLCISQGGEEDGEWQTQFNDGELNQWQVECAGCHAHVYPGWTMKRVVGKDEMIAGMRWDEKRDDRGLWLPEECADTARWECPACGHPHFDSSHTKSEWNRTGKYVVTGKASRTKKSFHWTALIDSPWRSLVVDYLGALNEWKHRGNPVPLIQFFQKRMAQMKSEKSLIGDDRKFTKEVYEIADKWPEEVARYMTIDRQEEDVYYWQIRAWSKLGANRRIAFGKAFGDAELEELRIKHGVQRHHVAIDSGFAPKGDRGVYAICVRHGWLAVKGDKAPYFFHTLKGGARVQRSYAEVTGGDPESGKTGQGRKFAPLIVFSSDRMSDRLAQLIAKGHWVEPVTDKGDATEIEYERQMSGEVRKEKLNKNTGKIEPVWVTIRANHQWDCGKIQVLLATLGGNLPDTFEVEKPPSQ